MSILEEQIAETRMQITDLENRMKQDLADGINTREFLERQIQEEEETLQELEETIIKSKAFDEAYEMATNKREQAIKYQVEYAEEFRNGAEISTQVDEHIESLDYALRIMRLAHANVRLIDMEENK